MASQKKEKSKKRKKKTSSSAVHYSRTANGPHRQTRKAWIRLVTHTGPYEWRLGSPLLRWGVLGPAVAGREPIMARCIDRTGHF